MHLIRVRVYNFKLAAARLGPLLRITKFAWEKLMALARDKGWDESDLLEDLLSVSAALCT